MILADKISEERKKLNLSQEELAEKLSVSRQAVSKWESAQSIPDLQRIIAMSELFSVSTDYLLKDEMEYESKPANEAYTDRTFRRVSMEEANAYMNTMEEQSKTIAVGVLMCIVCPVLLIFLVGLAEENIGGITVTVACVAGIAAIFILVAAAVFLFVQSSSKTERFDYLEKEEFETDYGVSGLVKEKKAAFEPVYVKYLSLGVILCVLSPLPLIITAVINDADALVTSMTALLLCIVAAGVYMIVRVAMIKESYEILLQEREYSKTEKKKNSSASTVNAVYWCVVTAGYLAWSFITMSWEKTWIVWPVAAVACAPVVMIAKLLSKDGDE